MVRPSMPKQDDGKFHTIKVITTVTTNSINFDTLNLPVNFSSSSSVLMVIYEFKIRQLHCYINIISSIGNHLHA